MDNYRAFLAIIISFVILVGYQYLFVGFDKSSSVDQPAQQQTTTDSTQPAVVVQQAAKAPVMAPPVDAAALPALAYNRKPKEITIETALFTAIMSEDGGAIKSFVLKEYKETHVKHFCAKNAAPGKLQ